MAVAGRVAIVPQDDYDITKPYKRLDMVLYNNGLYIAKKDNSGILPTDTTYWMKIGELMVQTMTEMTNGIGRPDGETITVDANGVFSTVMKAKFEVVTSVPAASQAEDGVIYLIANNRATTANKYDMYTLLDRKVECVNTAAIYDYEELNNLPEINNVLLTGNRTLSDLSIMPDDAILQFQNIAVLVDAWASDNTYSDYPYKADITLTGATGDYVPTVTFGVQDATSGNFAPVAETGNGYVRIYAVEVPDGTVTIPSIICEKGGV